MMDYKAISELTGVPVGTLRMWKLRGKLPPEDERLGYHSVFWNESTIEGWWQHQIGAHNERPDQG